MKLEGGRPVLDVVRRLVDVGIPVMGHLGLQPQSVHQLGGYGKRGSEPHEAAALVDDAVALEEAGAFAIVLESIPPELAQTVTKRVGVPTIGIGSGADCDGQVLVSYDMLGLFEGPVPSFVKQYANLADTVTAADTRVRRRCPDGTLSADALDLLEPLDSARNRHRGLTCSRCSTRLPRPVRRSRTRSRGSIGFVPTMGALHAGHASLIQRARRECGTVVVSIFVNPLQFDRPDDLERYPRSLDADLELCRQAGRRSRVCSDR